MYFSGSFPSSNPAYSRLKNTQATPRFGAKVPESLKETHGKDAQRIADYIEGLATSDAQRSRDIVIRANQHLGVSPAISKYHVQDVRGKRRNSAEFDTIELSSAPVKTEKEKSPTRLPEALPRSTSSSSLSSLESFGDFNPFLLQQEEESANKPLTAGNKRVKYKSIEDDYLSDEGRPENSSRDRAAYDRAFKRRASRRLAFVRQNWVTPEEKRKIGDELAETPEYKQADDKRRSVLRNNAVRRRASELMKQYFKD